MSLQDDIVLDCDGEEIRVDITPYSSMKAGFHMISMFRFIMKNAKVLDCLNLDVIFDTSSDEVEEKKADEKTKIKLFKSGTKLTDFTNVILENITEKEYEKWMKIFLWGVTVTIMPSGGLVDDEGESAGSGAVTYTLNNPKEFDLAFQGRIGVAFEIVPHVIKLNYKSLGDLWKKFLVYWEDRQKN